MSFLLDTNVLSELRKGPQANANVRAWEEHAEGEHFTSIVVIAELLKGAELRARRDAGGGAMLLRWLTMLSTNSTRGF